LGINAGQKRGSSGRKLALAGFRRKMCAVIPAQYATHSSATFFFSAPASLSTDVTYVMFSGSSSDRCAPDPKTQRWTR
jgi:hypothetical protein